MVGNGKMNVALDGKLFEEAERFKYLGSHIAVDEGIDGKVKLRMNEEGKVCGGIKSEKV